VGSESDAAIYGTARLGEGYTENVAGGSGENGMSYATERAEAIEKLRAMHPESPGFETAWDMRGVGFQLVETPLAVERRAFWCEIYRLACKYTDSTEDTAECADAALAEFDKRFGK
jgi:hypothetical protein